MKRLTPEIGEKMIINATRILKKLHVKKSWR